MTLDTEHFQPLNIGQAAERAGVSAKMIRHYEETGLIPKAKRTFSGYRLYTDKEVHTLRFVKQARGLGFSIEQIGNLLTLWQDRRRPSRKVKELALAHVRERDDRLRELQGMKRALELLIKHCHGDDRPDCPILESLESSRASETNNSRPKTTLPRKQRLEPKPRACH